MPNWKSYKSQTPFQFVVAPSESYNEGNKIAFSPKIPGKSPVWSMNMSGVAITPTHTPCRYWTGEGWEWVTWLERICMGLEISYTQTMMFPDEQQALRVKDSNGDIVDIDIVTWILTGVGSISADIGSSITYTAPSESLGTDTAVIEMWCNGEVKDTLTITFPGKITYTTPQQPPGTTQDLPIDSPNPACEYTWTLVGGGSLSVVNGVMRYTAPTTNPNCENNATISLLCNGVVVDTLDIAINTGGTGTAYYSTVCVTEGHCEEPVQVGSQWVTQFTVATVRITRYNCAGTETGTTTYCQAGGGICLRTLAQGPMSCADCLASKTVTSCGITYSRANHLSCAGKALECGAWCRYGLTDGPALGDLVDVRTSEQIAAGCCPAPLM